MSNKVPKTLDEIRKEVAQECAEEHFEVLIQAEEMVGDYEQVRRLLVTVANRYADQFKPKKQVKPSKSSDLSEFNKFFKRPIAPELADAFWKEAAQELYEACYKAERTHYCPICGVKH